MTETTGAPAPPKWYWLISGFGLVWNAVGVVAFVVQLTMDLSELPEAQQLFFEERPTWAVASFGLAVVSGVLGSLALLLRKSWAVPMLVVCIAGIALQTFHSIALTNGIEVFGPQGLVLPVMVFLIAVVLTIVGRTANRNGWTR